MSSTVVLVNSEGRLVNTAGIDGESGRLKNLARRMLGGSSGTAVLDYGWNNSENLHVACNGSKGSEIRLDASSVVVTGDQLNIGGKDLQDIIDDSMMQVLHSIRGTTNEIDVKLSEGDPSGFGESGVICTISLSQDIIDRIDTIEKTVFDLFRFEEIYQAGDGLMRVREEGRNILQVKLGEGLKFSEDSEGSEGSEGSGEDESAAITLDFDTTPTYMSNKPVTSNGIFQAIEESKYIPPYFIEVDTDGNMVLYSNVTPNS